MKELKNLKIDHKKTNTVDAFGITSERWEEIGKVLKKALKKKCWSKTTAYFLKKADLSPEEVAFFVCQTLQAFDKDIRQGMIGPKIKDIF